MKQQDNYQTVVINNECLRWHYHQSILMVARGTGEPGWNGDAWDEDVSTYGNEEKDKARERESVSEILQWESRERLGRDGEANTYMPEEIASSIQADATI
ncbi:hypothetical protein BDV10DRAFT_185691 [Aspergillus recurvatus]